MAEIGKLNKLIVLRKVDFGFYLDGEALGEIVLPTRDAPTGCAAKTELMVFIYRDSEDRLIATTKRPLAIIDTFAFLKVVCVDKIGAFLDWGLPKDLLVPFREQNVRMKEGESHLVRLYLDESGRIAASAKLDQYLDLSPVQFEVGQAVDLQIAKQTDIGIKAIVNGTHWGVIHFDDLFQKLKKGGHIGGFIKKVRQDGKLDLCLKQPGYGKISGISENILMALEKQGGFIAVTDKSSPTLIQETFGISKKSYKTAVGALYKKRLITLDKNGIRINKEPDAPSEAS